MASNLPYDYTKSRTRQERMDDGIAQGRRPSFGKLRSGEMFIRGFRSQRGATVSERDTMANLTGMNREPSGFTNTQDWGSFFQGNSPTGVRLGYRPSTPAVAAAAFPVPQQMPQAPVVSDNPTPLPAIPASPASMMAQNAGAQDYLGNVISNAQEWMKRNGYA